MLGSNLSAHFRGQDQAGAGEPSPSKTSSATGIGINAKNPRGLGTEPPEKTAPSYGLVSSFPLISIPFFRRRHVSAFNFCMSLFRLSGVAIIIQPLGLVN
jgi:hypothetical protein